MPDKVVEKLGEAQPNIDFISASDAVIEGHNLEESGNRSYGKNLYIATGSTPEVKLSDCKIGQTISVGSVEKFETCELRCAPKREERFAVCA
jgi:hypothetical protein